MRFHDVLPAASATAGLKQPAVSCEAFGAPSATNVSAARTLWKSTMSSGWRNASGTAIAATEAYASRRSTLNPAARSSPPRSPAT